uniref:Crp/Fnr family transcriptional regulator n=1 Tax=Alloprevotella sp. TaxID=1872471 RepID=UPI004027A7C6
DLGKADQRIVSITQKHVRGRMAETLLDMLDIYGYDTDKQTLNLHITREDMANLSNMTTSNAIRTLSMFSDEGLIDVHGRCIKLLDVDALQRISDNG